MLYDSGLRTLESEEMLDLTKYLTFFSFLFWLIACVDDNLDILKYQNFSMAKQKQLDFGQNSSSKKDVTII